MKMLILVLSSLKFPYNNLMSEQKKTWDSIKIKNVKTVFYFSSDKNKLTGNNLELRFPDYKYLMHLRLKIALEAVWHLDWDYLFRTNASTYVDKGMVYNYIKNNKPVYSGLVNGNYITGTNICISRKAADILRKDITIETPYRFPIEDIVIGDVLRKKNVLPKCGATINYFDFKNYSFKFADCYRCKTGIPGDVFRLGDTIAFNIIHKKLHGI